jgi:hypothetical protein
MLDRLTHADFEAAADERFILVAPGDRRVDLVLSRVQVLSSRSASPRAKRQPFSLLFHADLDRPLPQSTYRLEHTRLGVLEIFLVPLGPDSRGQRYEAIFT